MSREMKGVSKLLPGISSLLLRAVWMGLAVMFLLTSSVSALSMTASVAAAQNETGGESTQQEQPSGSSEGGSEEGGSSEGSGEDTTSGSGEESGSGSDSGESSSEGNGSEDSGSGSSEDSGSSSDSSSGGLGGMAGIAVGFFNAIGTHIWDWTIGWLGEKIGQSIGDSLLFLPDPSADQEVKGVYDEVKNNVRGLLVVGIIVMSLAMILRAANEGVQFTGLKVLPKILGVALVLGALPSLFGVLSTLGTDLTVALLPNGEQISAARTEMVKAVVGNLVITNFLNLILAVIGVYVMFVLIIVALLKSIVFVLLFIIAPFPLMASLIPGFEKYAVIWAKAVLVTAFLTAIWAAELWLGAVLIDAPEALFGEAVNRMGFLSNGAFTTIIAIGMFYLMYKTPFIAFSWAIPSYNPSGGGGLMSFGKFAAAAAMSAGIKGAVGGLIGAGAAKGSQSDPPSRAPQDSLGGKMKENKRMTTTTTTDHEGNERTSYREEHTVDASRDRNMEHDEVMAHFNKAGDDGPGGSPPPAQTQIFNSGGRRGGGSRLNRGDRPRDDDGFSLDDDKRGDRGNVPDRRGEE